MNVLTVFLLRETRLRSVCLVCKNLFNLKQARLGEAYCAVSLFIYRDLWTQLELFRFRTTKRNIDLPYKREMTVCSVFYCSRVFWRLVALLLPSTDIEFAWDLTRCLLIQGFLGNTRVHWNAWKAFCQPIGHSKETWVYCCSLTTLKVSSNLEICIFLADYHTFPLMTVQGIKWYIKLLRGNYFIVIGWELANLLLIFNVECSVNLCARVHNFLSHIILIMTEKVQVSK